MATQVFSRSLPKTLIMASIFSRSFFSTTTTTAAALSSSSTSSFSLLRRLRPLAAIVSADIRRFSPATSVRDLATRATSSSLSDPNPNWSNRPPKETILLDGCDFEHWLVVMEKPEGEPVRDEIIDSYIKTLAMVVGSEEEARMKIYSVSTRCYFAFGCLVSEELSYKIKELPRVRWVLPDSYLDVRNKNYGGEPFINGQALPYDPIYHEEWIRNNARANERNRRNDRPRNFDRSRNFERRRDNVQNREFNGPPPGGNFNGPPQSGNFNGPPPSGNFNGPPPSGNFNAPPPSGNFNAPPPSNNFNAPPPSSNFNGPPPSNNYNGPPRSGNFSGLPPSNNFNGPPPGNNFDARQPNYGGMPRNNMGGMSSSNYDGAPPDNYGGAPSPSYGVGGGGGSPNNYGEGMQSNNVGWSNNGPNRVPE